MKHTPINEDVLTFAVFDTVTGLFVARGLTSWDEAYEYYLQDERYHPVPIYTNKRGELPSDHNLM